MKNKYLYFIPLFALMLVGVFALGGSMNATPSSTNTQMIKYNSMVCTDVIRADGTIEDNGCSHNVLYTTGKELIETFIGTGSTDACDWIELCDSVAAGCGTPVVGSTETYTAHANDGMQKVAGTVASNGGSGNFSVWNTFTSSATNQLTNVSHLLNGAGDKFAGNSFALVNLSNGDSLLINWTIWVT